MSVAITTLDNGFRIVTQSMPHVETVALGVWIANGSRCEGDGEHGITHFLEHMAFKGTMTRSARRLAEEIENVGGEINAATGVEQTAYFSRVLKGDLPLAIEILSDILLNPRFDEGDLVIEQGVVQQEIAASRDSPEEVAYELLEDAVFPDQPLGRPILGTIESVSAFTPAALRAYLSRHYRPERMVLSAAGALDHEVLVDLAVKKFAGLRRGKRFTPEPARYCGGVRIVAGDYEQSHLYLAFKGPSYLSPDFVPAQVLSGVLGGGASSRLFQEARERRGLCYAIESFVSAYADAGFLAVHAATAPGAVERLLGVVLDEMSAVCDGQLTVAEVARAKAQLKAGLVMSLESPSARADQLGRQTLIYGRPLEIADLMARVDEVTLESVVKLAHQIVLGAKPAWTEVGAVAKDRSQLVIERFQTLAAV